MSSRAEGIMGGAIMLACIIGFVGSLTYLAWDASGWAGAIKVLGLLTGCAATYCVIFIVYLWAEDRFR